MRDQENWTADEILALARTYQPATILMAAAELNLFTYLHREPLTPAALAAVVQCDLRGIQTLLDALAALGLVNSAAGKYSLPPGAGEYLAADSPATVLGMVCHQANCVRRWGQLAEVVKSGLPAKPIPSVRGESGDLESFIQAMHNVSEPVAESVIGAIQPLEFRRLLDIGGASGTWSAAFLKACPAGKAVLLDLPEVLPMARRRLEELSLDRRVEFLPANYLKDPLPSGIDLAWISAVVHQNSPEENRDLLLRVYNALEPGGRVAIRDIVMDEDRSKPLLGALFAVNMLVATEGGGTFTFRETREWLEAAGFSNVTLARPDPGMHAVIVAAKI